MNRLAARCVRQGMFLCLLLTAISVSAAPRAWLAAMPRADLAHLLKRGFIGAIVAFASFGGIMLATLLGPVGQAAVLRETSTVFSALIGWLMLGEHTGPRRVALMAMIAAGAVIVQLAA